jgi:hypothetical protein
MVHLFSEKEKFFVSCLPRLPECAVAKDLKPKARVFGQPLPRKRSGSSSVVFKFLKKVVPSYFRVMILACIATLLPLKLKTPSN